MSETTIPTTTTANAATAPACAQKCATTAPATATATTATQTTTANTPKMQRRQGPQATLIANPTAARRPTTTGTGAWEEPAPVCCGVDFGGGMSASG